jgi:uncharacterized protein
MKCPACTGVNLALADRQGIEIDYCPKCRGVWLDRGELDKIIERVGAAPVGATPGSWAHEGQASLGHHPHGHGGHHDHGKSGHYRRQSVFERLFDFD